MTWPRTTSPFIWASRATSCARLAASRVRCLPSQPIPAFRRWWISMIAAADIESRHVLGHTALKRRRSALVASGGGDVIAQLEGARDQLERLHFNAGAVDNHVAVIQQAARYRLNHVDARHLVHVHFGGAPADEPGLGNDASVSDGNL